MGTQHATDRHPFPVYSGVLGLHTEPYREHAAQQELGSVTVALV